MSLFLKLVCSSWGIQRLGLLKLLWCVSRKGSLNEGLEYDCLSPATIVESLESSVWVVLTNPSRERGGKVVW